MFYGEFDYKVDEKGRVPVPPRFRPALKDGIVLTPGQEKCITCYTPVGVAEDFRPAHLQRPDPQQDAQAEPRPFRHRLQH